MSIETLLATVSFAASLGGLLPVFFLKDRRREVTLAVILGTLVITTGLALREDWEHRRFVEDIEVQIVSKLSTHTWTFDQLYAELYYAPSQVVSEALSRAVANGRIGHRLMELRGTDGAILQVKGYYLEEQLK